MHVGSCQWSSIRLHLVLLQMFDYTRGRELDRFIHFVEHNGKHKEDLVPPTKVRKKKLDF